MDDVHLLYCKECLKDHEDRIRNLEQNNKLELRVEILEKFMSGQISTGATRKESRADVYALIGMCISVATFLILIWKLA
jgi:hypothetical protein